MIEIDDDLYLKREFSGRVVVSFDRGNLQQISIDETVHHKDPEMYNKLLKHGIRQRVAIDGDKKLTGASADTSASRIFRTG